MKPGPAPYHRLPFAPIGSRIRSVKHFATVANIDRTQLQRWKREGLTIDAADRVACAAGYHPAELWPEWWDIAS